MHPSVFQSLMASLFTWAVTALGAALVFVFAEISDRSLNALYAASSGVMIASSCFGLLNPALEASHASLGRLSWLPVAAGLALAYALFSAFEAAIEKATAAKSHASIAELAQSVEGVGGLRDGGKSAKSRGRAKNSAERDGSAGAAERAAAELSAECWRQGLFGRLFLMLSAITLHNFPEGLAIGIAFGAAKMCAADEGPDCSQRYFRNAVALTLGIALQNLPEGIAVAFPLRRCGVSARKSFFYGQLSAAVEPLGAVLGALVTTRMQQLLPLFLSFAAGAMIFVTVGEMIPESFSKKANSRLNSFSFLVGFILMMVLEVALE